MQVLVEDRHSGPHSFTFLGYEAFMKLGLGSKREGRRTELIDAALKL